MTLTLQILELRFVSCFLFPSINTNTEITNVAEIQPKRLGACMTQYL